MDESTNDLERFATQPFIVNERDDAETFSGRNEEGLISIQNYKSTEFFELETEL